MVEPLERSRESAAHLTQAIERVLSIDAHQIRRRTDRDISIEFDEAEPYFDSASSFCRLIGADPTVLAQAPAPLLAAVHNAAHQVYEIHQQIVAFPVRDPDAARKKQDILGRLQNSVDSLGAAVGLVLPFTKHEEELRDSVNRQIEALGEGLRASIQDLIAKADDRISNSSDRLAATEKEQKQLLGQLEPTLQEAKQLIQTLSEESGKSAVSETATFFDDEAERHRSRAFAWICATIFVGGLALIAAVWSLVFAAESPIFNTSTAIHVSVAKIVVFSLLSVCFVWCARNYGAHCHNETLYWHRANALNTFEKFVGSTQSDHVRNMILLHASQAAFGQRKTGFDRAEETSDQIMVNGILEKALGRAEN